MPTATEVREKSRICLQVAMEKSSRSARHSLARRALVLAQLAEKVDSGGSLTEDEVALIMLGAKVLGR
jgi:hypothetical protein